MDKNKIIEAATKYVQQGKYDKAIKEYEKALEMDPKDARIQQKLGELFQKKGENARAADCFLKVAESYATDGFALRAVAVYKQVLKLDEKRVDINLKLAELYQQLGLMSDAMGQLQLVTAYYEKTGNSSGSLDLLKRMVELDPDNVGSRIKLAELYARDSLNAEAVSEFKRAASYLKRNNRIDDYVKVAERLVFLDPGDIELSRELAQIYLTKQDTKRALAKLQICFKANPRDLDTLTLLAQAFLELGQTSKTVSVYKELAKIYDEADKVEEERAVWEKIRAVAPDDPDAARKLSSSAPVEEPAYVAPVAPARAAASPRGTSTFKRLEEPPATLTSDQIAKLLTETDVYVKYGLQDKAQEHLKKIFAADPDNVEANDKAYQIAVAAGEKAAYTEEKLIRVIRLAAAQGDLVRARARLQTLLEQNPGHDSVPEFLQTIGAAAPEEAHEIVDDSILIDSVDEAQVVEDEPAMEAAVADDEMIVSGDGDELLATPDEPLVSDDEPMLDEALSADEPLTSGDEALAAASDEPLSLEGDEAVLASGDESLSDEPLALADEPLSLVADDEALLVASQDEASTLMGDASLDEVLVADRAELSADEVIAGAEAAGAEDAFQEARDEAALPATDEPPTSEQGRLAAAAPDESDFGSLNDDDRRPPQGFAGEGEGATRVVNLADLAKMREAHLAAKAAAIAVGTAALAPLPEQELPTVARMVAAPPAAHRPPEEVEEPKEVGEQVTLARVPVARPPSRSLAAAQPKPTSRMSTSASLAAAPPAAQPEEPLEAVAPPPEEQPEEAAAPPEEHSTLEGAEDPASEELEEAAFFIEQGVFDEAREILETVQLAYPGNPRAGELMAQLEAKEAASATPEAPAASEDSAFDLAAELAEELGDGGESAAPLATGDDGFQISAEDVFAEFKKGVSKMVKPEDVDTHYDLGIAYKEMGLLPDSIGEFEQAMAGAIGKPRELDCHLMIASCRQLQGDPVGAIAAFRTALSLTQLSPDQAKAFQFDIAATYEGMGHVGKALAYYLKVARVDPGFREAQAQVERLEADGAEPEDEEPAAKKANGANGTHANGVAPKPAGTPPEPPNKPASRKIGYV